MKLPRPDTAAMVVLALVVVAVTACAIARVDVPDFLTTIGLVVAGIGGGTALNAPRPPAAPAPAPVRRPPLPRPNPLLAATVDGAPSVPLNDPPTGTFARIAERGL